jgi:hypothetical protein
MRFLFNILTFTLGWFNKYFTSLHNIASNGKTIKELDAKEAVATYFMVLHQRQNGEIEEIKKKTSASNFGFREDI